LKDSGLLIFKYFSISLVYRVIHAKNHKLINLKLGDLDKPREMTNLRSVFTTIVIFMSLLVIGCSRNSQTNKTSALFATKAEAEKAAKDFNCTGAHKMGNKWMPCKIHADHKEAEEHDSHNGHNHHH
tara:strand:- start:253 stop:633 length:381 start_codon:yes stop_codon:yes gene_type:complete